MEKEIIDYYKILGIKKDASPEIIKEMYRRAMMECHPDMHSKSDEETQKQAEHAARILNDMRATLLNPEKRKAYDAELETYYERLKRPTQSPTKQSYKYEFYDDTDDELTLSETLEMIKEAYTKARKEEKSYPISKRHKDIGKEYRETVGTVINNNSARKIIGLGAHMAQEIVYQLSKLRYRKGENFLEYSMRNRKNIATFLLAFSLFTSSILDNDRQVVSNTTPEEQTEIMDPEPQVTLTRYYTIESSDTLSNLAYDAGITVEKLKSTNGISSDVIYAGDTIRIPYNINESDLVYYGEMIDVQGRSPEEIAELYETDVVTLKRLNVNAIEMIDGKETILTNQIFVPNFIGRDALQVLKIENDNQNKLS